MLRDTPVVLMDEPTSSLDAATERLVVHGLRRLMEGRTAIIISHHFRTIGHVDQVAVIEEGRLVESGPNCRPFGCLPLVPAPSAVEGECVHLLTYAVRPYTSQPRRCEAWSPSCVEPGDRSGELVHHTWRKWERLDGAGGLRAVQPACSAEPRSSSPETGRDRSAETEDPGVAG